MGNSIDSIICINKDLFNKLLLITKNSSDIYVDENNGNYFVEESIVKKVVKDFNTIFKDIEHIIPKNTKGVSFNVYNELTDKYNELKFNAIRNNFNKIKTDKINFEDDLKFKLDIYEEAINMSKIPSYIESIKKELKEIKDNGLSENINSYLIRFNSLLSDGGILREYMSLKGELDLIIKKTYTDNIVSDINDNKKIYLVKSNNEFKILDYGNINNFSYGYIYSANSINDVTEKNSHAFVTFYNYSDNTCKININDDEPIAYFAVTYGEKEINNNYKNAQSICGEKNLPFIELDQTEFNPNDFNKKELIDNLLVDKGIEISDKNESFYNLFTPFYIEFKNLKLSGNYTQGNIINLFDYYFDVIFSQKYLDLNILLSSACNFEKIKDILSYNKFYDFNIFRSGRVNDIDISNFYNHFYDYKSNRILNMVYPGLEQILIMLDTSNQYDKSQITKIISDAPCRDSWLIYKLVQDYLNKLSVARFNKNIVNLVSNALDNKEHHVR